MTIPDSIKRQHILKALKAIRLGAKIPPRRKARRYDLLFRGKRYPSKYAISLAHTFVSPGHTELRKFKGGKQTIDFLESRGFAVKERDARRIKGKVQTKKPRGIINKQPVDKVSSERRSFWTVSPNVRRKRQTVSKWIQASIVHRAAFMGYGPENHNHKQIGYKFAHVIRENDIILIGRRSRGKPEVVGFGTVKGSFKEGLKASTVPDSFGSLRQLSPFLPFSSAPARLPVKQVLRHTTALRQLHPDRSSAESAVCRWMEKRLAERSKKRETRAPEKQDVRLAKLSPDDQLEYQVRTRRSVDKAKKIEAALLNNYIEWLNDQHRTLHIAKYKRLRCDAYEENGNNLIEAKSSVRREHLRMAVGQLLDYCYLGKKHFGRPNKAILLPKKPGPELEAWLSELQISVIWREGRAFLDNANRQFT